MTHRLLPAFATLVLVLSLVLVLLLAGCTAKEAIKTPVNVLGMLFGRLPPPPQTTVLQELRREYEKCVGDGGLEAECTQQAYETVRLAKGLDSTRLPAGTVTVRRDDGAPSATTAPPAPTVQPEPPTPVDDTLPAESTPTPTDTDQPTDAAATTP